MQISVIIATHNEGCKLWKTVESVFTSISKLSFEVIVADDASVDNSVNEVKRRFPQVVVLAHGERHGCSATKDLGARISKGDILVFLDAHCKPELGAIGRLAEDVAMVSGKTIFVPKVAALDCETWENKSYQVGEGYVMRLEDFECQWTYRDKMRRHGSFYESPALIGCCVAVSRQLYEELYGFDRHMIEWGIEDIDFGFKAWLTGHEIFNDSEAVIGHRFQKSFDNYSVSNESILANQLRMARKNFTDTVWLDWIKRCRKRKAEELWTKGWALFEGRRDSAERERECLLPRRVRDEFAYAEQFDLEWPCSPLTHRNR